LTALTKVIKRHYTKSLENSGKSVYDLFEWKTVDVVLTNYSTGQTITDMKGLAFPEHYSQSACDIIASKYFRKKGVPNARGHECSMREAAHRMVSFWVESLLDEKMITPEQKEIVYDELVYTLLAQIWAPNSPQWFNTGLKLAYGIQGSPQDVYYYDETKGEVALAEDSFTRTFGSACFILSIADSLMGEKSLTDQLTTETLLFKFGSGAGTNWSTIRSKDEKLSGGGKSSGLLSFLKVSDRNAGAIKSGGTTRRAAKMNVLNLDHPEILDYINWKRTEEDKVAALAKMGYSPAIDGEAYETVSGQNANNSIRIPNAFMEQLDNPAAGWKTYERTTGNLAGEVPVEEIWNSAALAAWRCGDPGVQYDDIINAWHTCPAGEDGQDGASHNRINASNPCSEYMFLDDTACNLASINIAKFYDPASGHFDLESYLHTVALTQMVLESTIHWGQFPTKDIARKSYGFRTTGLGLANLGTLFMQMGLPYDSDESRAVGAALTSILTGYSYYTSSLMAAQTSPFAHYEQNKIQMNRVIRNHARAASALDFAFENLPYRPVVIDHDLLHSLSLTNVSDGLKSIWADTIQSGQEHGYRNAQVTVLAPTGTIAFAMDCASTSSEPFFSHIAYKKLVGGGFMTIVNPAIEAALTKLGYSEAQTSDILAYVLRTENRDGRDILIDGKIEGAPHLKPEHYGVFDTANKCGSGQRSISAQGHVKMMGALSPHVTGAISKTVNLPNEATVEDIKNIYFLSWKLGVKAIALYRDGSKSSQPLESAKTKTGTRDFEDFSYKELIDYIHANRTSTRVKPTGIRSAHVHEASIDGLKLYISTSFYDDGQLAEIYVTSGREGSLVKGLLNSISKTISVMMQYGVPPADIAKMYRGQKYEPSGFITDHPYIKYVDSVSDLISKIIDIELGDYTYCQVKPKTWNAETFSEKSTKKGGYSAAEYIHGEVCRNCQSTKLVKSGVCKVCTECGTTTGCS